MFDQCLNTDDTAFMVTCCNPYCQRRECSSKTREPVVIVTDDNRATRRMIRSIFEPDGLKILEAENGEEALELFASYQPDLVMLDVVMPVMGGLEACTQIKQLSAGRHVPVLIFTASNEAKDVVEQAFLAGATDFINKPLNPKELRHRVKRLLYLRMLEMKREAAELKLQSNYEEIQTLSAKVLHAYEEERLRLARELHDELGMTLTTLKLNFHLLNQDLSAKGLEMEEQMSSIIELINNALAAIRNKALLMRPPALDNLGLVAAVENMVNEFGRHTNIHASMETTGKYLSLPVEVETALYRCIQEALTNAARHSSAGNVLVKLTCDDQAVSVTVEDDGIGFNADSGSNPTGHHGLQGMKERVALLGGKIEINSAPAAGTDIMITVPLARYQKE